MSPAFAPQGCIGWQGITRIWWSQGGARQAHGLHAVMRPGRWMLDRVLRFDLGMPDAGRHLLAQAIPYVDGTSSWVLYLGNDSPYRKFVALLYDDDGRLLVSTKTPVGVWARAALANEQRICAMLGGRLAHGIRVPCPRHDGLAEATPFVIQSGLDGDPGRDAGWMHAYVEACVAHGHADFARAFVQRRSRLQALLRVGTVWETPVRNALMLLDRCEARVTTQEPPWGLSHRDLRVANLLQATDGVGIIDWEWGDDNWCPLADLRHYVDNLPFVRRLAAMRSVRKWGVDAALIRDLLLLDKASIYLPATAEMGLLPSAGACGTIVLDMQRTVTR